ncbi:hypothetical protein [Pseudomonas sp. RL_35y_Pfl2_P42]|uniref:hypothetical protein n=1 Tax=Pseudomonas sp. RL_35y_Pfl2_P42 TaxID=3088710 RepID=UPI0030D9D50C
MSSEVAGKLFKSYGVFCQEHQRRKAFDAEERELVLAQLRDGLKEQGVDPVYSWQGYTVEVRAGSSFYEVFNPGRVFWSKLANNDRIMSELRRHRALNMALVRVNEKGGVEVFRKETEKWHEVDLDNIPQLTYLYKNVLVVGDIAKQAGGYIYDVDYVDIDQWLKFHGLPVPQTLAQTKNLIGYFEFNPKVDVLGNFWTQLDAEDHSLIVLSAEQCRAIRLVTAQLVGAGKKLLDVLHRNTGQTAVTEENVAGWVGRVLSHTFARDLATAYLQKLQWFGSQPGDTPSNSGLARLLVTALLLDVDPSIGGSAVCKSIAGLELYAPSNVGRDSKTICQELQSLLVTKQMASIDLAPVAAHLLLAGIAPEFLVKGIPSSLLLGSVDWMSYCRAVVLAESVRKGASRVLSYEQIVAYADLEPLTEAQVHLRDLAMIGPMVDWALINEVVTSSELASNEKETTERALSAFQGYADHFVPRNGRLPDRRLIAKQALEDAAPLCDFLEDKVLHQHPGLGSSPTAACMIDLHMSGDLSGGEWDRPQIFPDNVYSNIPSLHGGVTNYQRPKQHDPSVASIHEEFPRLRRLRPNDQEFHRQLRVFETNLNRSLIATVKLALSNMPHADLQAFLQGTVTFFTFRDNAIETSSHRIAGPLTYEVNYETRQGKDAATGRFGLLMCVKNGAELTSYELFTLRGELIKNNQLGNELVKKGLFQQPARIDFNGDLKAHDDPIAKSSFNIDFSKYLYGDSSEFVSGSGQAVAEKLGVLHADSTSVKLERSVYRNFSHPQLVRLAEFIVSHHPIISFDELVAAAAEPTELERERAKGEKIATYFVDLAVPFKKCIEDISSGEHNKVVDGVYGCLMDVIALGGAFYGAGVKALSISAKAISAASKAARVTKLVVATSVSAFNPVDGVPTAIYGVSKLVHKGLLRFSKPTLELLGLAKSQLGTMHGSSKGKNLIRSVDNASAAQGTWRPNASVADTLTCLAARNNYKWYALDRLGKPWGPALDNFNVTARIQLPRINRTLPVSYTRLFLEQSLPRARVKIESAISVLMNHDYRTERDALIKILMGKTSGDAANRVLDYLRAIRADFAGVSISNFVLDPLKQTNDIAEFDPQAYKQWKRTGGENPIAFIHINTPNINRQFIDKGMNHDVVADDVIHELFHGVAQSHDVGYAQEVADAARAGQQLDVTALLNLALGRLPVADSDSLLHPSAMAFENADSLAVLTSLLGQMSIDKATFESNLKVLREAVEKNEGSTVVGPVLIRLNVATTHDLTDPPLEEGWSRPVSQSGSNIFN